MIPVTCTTDEISTGIENSSKEAQLQATEIVELSKTNFTQALRKYREMVETEADHKIRDESFYCALVGVCVRVGTFDILRQVVLRAQKNNVNLSERFFKSTMKLLVAKLRHKDCLWFYETFRDVFPSDRSSLRCIALEACICGESEVAEAALDRLHLTGGKTRRDSPAEVTSRDYMILFQYHAKNQDWNAMVELLDKLVTRNIEVETGAANSVLTQAVQAGRIDLAYQILQKGLTTSEGVVVQHDVSSWNIVMKGHAEKHELETCFCLAESMRGIGIQPDDVSYGILLDACVMENSLDRAAQVLEQLKSSGLPMNTVLYTIVMKGFIKSEQLGKAVELHSSMRTAGEAKPDLITYSVLIKGHVDKRLLESALDLLGEMLQDGLEPDDLIVNHLLEGCRFVEDLKLGEQIFKDFVASGRVTPSPYTLSTMIKLYGKCGQTTQAAALVREMDSRFNIKPSVIMFTCLMSACVRNGETDKALVVLADMRRGGIEPDEMTYATLVRGFAQRQEWGKVVDIARDSVLLTAVSSQQQQRKQGAPQRRKRAVPVAALRLVLTQMKHQPFAEQHAAELTDILKSLGQH